VDERQMSLFAAGWTLGSLAALARAGGLAATYYQTVGWQGLIQGEAAPARPELFAAQPGDVFPVYHLFRFLASWDGDLRAVLEVVSSHPQRFSGLYLQSGGRGCLLLASHHPAPLTIRLAERPFTAWKFLDETNADQARRNPAFWEAIGWQEIIENQVILLPHGLAILR
jgi:hypothetical protein